MSQRREFKSGAGRGVPERAGQGGSGRKTRGMGGGLRGRSPAPEEGPDRRRNRFRRPQQEAKITGSAPGSQRKRRPNRLPRKHRPGTADPSRCVGTMLNRALGPPRTPELAEFPPGRVRRSFPVGDRRRQRLRQVQSSGRPAVSSAGRVAGRGIPGSGALPRRSAAPALPCRAQFQSRQDHSAGGHHPARRRFGMVLRTDFLARTERPPSPGRRSGNREEGGPEGVGETDRGGPFRPRADDPDPPRTGLCEPGFP